MAQALIYDDAGNPIFVVYGEDGEIIREIGSATGTLEDAVAVSALSYNSIVEAYRLYLIQEQDGAARGSTVLTRDAYVQFSFTTPDNKPVNKPQLQDGTKTVLVRGQETLLIPGINPILFEATIDLNAAVILPSEIVSLIIDNNGSVVETAVGNIGFKVGFYEGEENNSRNGLNEIYGPVAGVVVHSGLPFPGAKAATGEDGKYTMFYYLPPCPGFSFEYKADLYAKLTYKNFNPRGAKRGSYFLWSPAFDYCSGIGDLLKFSSTLTGLMSYVAIQGINATRATPNYNNDFKIDTMLLTGKGKLSNGNVDIEIGSTEYSYDAPESKITTQSNYDFDNDGLADFAFLGITVEKDLVADTDNEGNLIVPQQGGDGSGELDEDSNSQLIKYFKRQTTGATVQGVYFSSVNSIIPSEGTEPTLDNQPNITRILDIDPNFSHQGLLSSISEEDLRNTDLYVFRESNGDLLTERIGLKANEIRFINTGGNIGNKIFYQVLMRGPRSLLNPGTIDFEQWQSKTQINPKLHFRKADHLRVGEKVRILAVNRATGYLGSIVTELQQTGIGGDISFGIEDIILRPPNLKIKATRFFQVANGAERGEEKENIISFEGGALKSDTFVKVETIWNDSDGSPLPAGFSDYGYTGRLAKIVSENTLGTSTNELAHFSIKPGSNIQLIQLNENTASTEYFYIQVNALPINRSPDFSTLGAGLGALKFRPKNYVPFLVPQYDEKLSLELTLEYNRLTNLQDEQQATPVLEKPKPIYQWLYRPEMAFSLFDLSINAAIIDSDNFTIDNFDSLNLTPSSSLVLLYDLISSVLAPLELISNQTLTLILSIGGQETEIIWDGSQLVFSDLSHLQFLDAADFLTMQIYLNNDEANVLLPFEFVTMDLIADMDNDNKFFKPDASPEEKTLENFVIGPGKILQVNDSISNIFGVAEYLNFGEFSNISDLEYNSDIGFATMLLRIPKIEDYSKVTISFDFKHSKPVEFTTVYKDETDGFPVFNAPEPGFLRLWKKKIDEVRVLDGVTPDFIEPNKNYTLSELGFVDNQQELELYVESVRTSIQISDLTIKATLTEIE